jgi:hypothetical protein
MEAVFHLVFWIIRVLAFIFLSSLFVIPLIESLRFGEIRSHLIWRTSKQKQPISYWFTISMMLIVTGMGVVVLGAFLL